MEGGWEGKREGEYKRAQEGRRETRHTGLVRSRLWRLGVGLVSEGPWVQTGRGRETRKQRSILSELGSYPRGHRTGLARGESQRRREGVGVGRIVVLFISFYSGLKCNTEREKEIYVSTRHRYLCTFEHLCMWKHCLCISALINQSIKGLLPREGHTRSSASFCHCRGESYIRGSNGSKTETKTERKSEVTLPCPQHRGKSLTPRLINHWK